MTIEVQFLFFDHYGTIVTANEWDRINLTNTLYREFPSSEVASYAALCGLHTVAVPHPSSLVSLCVCHDNLLL